MSSSSSEQQPFKTPLREPQTIITTHDEAGKATIHSTRPAQFKPYEGGTMAFNQIFTNPFRADLNDEKDISYHDDIMAGGNLGLAKKGGVVCRMVDFSPGYVCMMHRTQSLDFGVVVEGEVELILDDGTERGMGRGDVAVQRGTMHAWRNPSKTEWARMMFVLQDMKPLVINGERYGEDYGEGTEGLPKSGNDD
ncbi:hypothetical protein GGS20DRAFT_586095 [Poronia punctata]|nr:hypothetical protein GGS20DRAFT_586095 [Poronia punctata]